MAGRKPVAQYNDAQLLERINIGKRMAVKYPKGSVERARVLEELSLLSIEQVKRKRQSANYKAVTLSERREEAGFGEW